MSDSTAVSVAIVLDLEDVARRYVAGLPELSFQHGDGDGAKALLLAAEEAFFDALRRARAGLPERVERIVNRGLRIDALIERDGPPACAYCDRPLDRFAHRSMPDAVQLDHVHPRSRGGADELDNLAMACRPCNLAKGSRTVTEFLTARRAAALAEASS